MDVIYHRLIKKDLRTALDYYASKGGENLADRFFDDAEQTVDKVVAKVVADPKRFHFSEKQLRRAPFTSFPYHFLYEEREVYVRFLVLRNDRRHPSYGLRRR